MINLLFLRDSTFVCGPGKTILNTYRTLDRSRFNLTLAIPVEGDEQNALIDRAEQEGIEVLRLPTQGALAIKAISQLARLLKERNIDIVQSHDFRTRRLAIPAAAMAGVCHVTSIHGWITNSTKQELARQVDYRLIRRARAVIAVSDRLRRQLLEDAGVRPERTILLSNAILLGDYQAPDGPDAAREQLGLSKDARVIAIVGRLSLEKGHDLFLQMAARIAAQWPEARFLIVGQGPLRRALEVRAAELGIQNRVMFLGHRTDMHRIYPAIDVLALCSSTEGLPNVVLEAFAYRRPVVATRVGGVPEVVTDSVNGIIVEPGSLDGVTMGVRRLLGNPAIAAEMGEQGRRTVEDHFDFQRRTRALEALYERLARRAEPLDVRQGALRDV